MAIEGVDFSWARPGGAALVAAGKKFVVRYVPYSGDGGKGLTRAEIKDYQAHGLGIALVFESTAGRFRDGRAAGVADAKTAQAALAALGLPLDMPIYFAVDRDVNAADWPVIDAYLGGAASVITVDRTGVYGEYSLMNHCRSARTASWFWQTYAWSGGSLASFVHLYQYKNGQRINGGAVDFTRALRAEFGQAGSATSSPAAGASDVGLTVNLDVTHDKDPYDALGTAKVAADGTRKAYRISDGTSLSLSNGLNLGVVQKATWIDDGDTPSYVTNIGSPSEAYVIRAGAVDFTPLPKPVTAPTDCTPAVTAAVEAQKVADAAELAKAVDAQKATDAVALEAAQVLIRQAEAARDAAVKAAAADHAVAEATRAFARVINAVPA